MYEVTHLDSRQCLWWTDRCGHLENDACAMALLLLALSLCNILSVSSSSVEVESSPEQLSDLEQLLLAIAIVLLCVCLVLVPGNYLYCRARPPERPTTATASCQTNPQVYVELMQGSQRPLDLVCCIDSSASVGNSHFEKSVLFLERVLNGLELPKSAAGVIQFNHEYTVVSEMTRNRLQLHECLRSMSYIPGETKLAPVLQQAGRMLRNAQIEGHRQGTRDKQIVLVLTDGDPNDLNETVHQVLVGV